MAIQFKFPDVGEGIHEGTLVKWIVKEGETVEADQNIAEVETDKAVVEIPSPKKGTLLKTYHKEGEVITVGEVLAVIGEPGEEIPEPPEKEESAGEEKADAPYTGSIVGFVPEESTDLDEQRKNQESSSSEKASAGVQASPRTRKIAKDLGIDLAKITGTGPGGRITDEDVTSAAKGGASGEASAPAEPKKAKVTKKYDLFGYVDRIPFKGIRKITAERMSEVARNYALVTHHDHVDVTDLNSERKTEKEKAAKEGVSITFLPYIIKACVKALQNHPQVASSVEDDEILIKKYYNVGVAVDTPDGLMVPVIKGADQKGLYDLAKQISEFVEKAKSRKIDLMDLKGGVFTITNIGVIGSTYFTPIPNYPESCIFGTGRIEDRPRVHNGEVAVRKIMPISFTYDHRVIDGAEAARFMNDIIELLESPEKLKE